MIKAVLFDFDETLQDRTAAFDRYADAFLQEFFPGISAEDAEKRKNDMIDTGNGGYVNRVKWFSELIDMWNWENSPGAEALARHYDEKFGFFNVIFDDAIPLLKELRSRGIITGVITNGPSILQHTKMDNSGLLPYCDILVVSGDIEYAKPQPQIFKYTADKLGLDLVIVDKKREKANQSEVMNIIGDVRGKNCLIVDDMVDTAGSIVAAAKALKDNGAKEVMMACTHPVLSDPAYERLTQAKVFSKIYVTDSIPLPKKFANNPDLNIHVCSLAPIIANAITAINTDSSVSHAYDMYKE